MLDKVIHFSIHNKLIIGLFTLGLIIWGGYSVTQLSIDAVPDITNNQVQIITVSPSLGAQDIERLVTFPVEQTMATIPEIEEMRSFSRFGLSIVTVVFQENTDVYWARQQVSERLIEAQKRIPDGVGTPEMAPVTTGLGEIYQYVLHTEPGYEDEYSLMELRTIQDWIVKRQLIGTPGVADVSTFGGKVKQYEIAVDPARLRSMQVSISDIFTALEKNNQNTGGAYIDKKPSAYFIRSEGLVGSLEDIGNIVVRTGENGIPVLVRNVAEVQYGSAIRYGALSRNGEGETVGGIVMMLKGANSSEVIKNVKDRIAQIQKNLPNGVVIEPFLDRTKLVDNAIETVTTNLAEGALIVIFVLVLFLGNFRAGLVVASVIPLALLFAIALMNLFGVSGNLMSLGAIDFGLIVDGAVIIVEATLHHLGLKVMGRKLTQQEMDEEVYTSASKIRKSAAFGEIIILIVYLPILALVGTEGKMFRPMAQTVGFAILGAFILSLTYVPMISALFLNKNVNHKKTISDRIMAFFQKVYDPAIHFALRRKVAIVSISVILFIGSLFVFLNMGGEFIPTLEEGDFTVETRVISGSSLSETVEAAQKASKIILAKFPEVKEVVAKLGTGEIPTDPMPVEAGDLMIILKDRDEWTSADNREDLAAKMSEALEVLPGVTFGFQQPIQMRFNELMTGAKQDIVVKIYGEDLDKLTAYAEQVGAIAGTVEGAQDIYVEEITGLSEIVVTYNRDKLAQFGLNIEEVNQVLQTGFAGQSAGVVYEGERRFDLVVRLGEENRGSLDDIRNLFVTSAQGEMVPLGQVAEVEMKPGPNQIQRDDTQRRIIVGFNTRGRDVGSIVEEVRQKIATEVNFDPGYYPTYGGQFENLQEAQKRLAIAVPIALLLIFILLYFTFGSMKYGLLIFTAIPLSAIGGVLALWMRGMPFSVSAGIGFIALFGVAVLNGIVLIGEFNRLKKEEGLTDLREIVLQGTRIRLRPVLMTALVASLGFLPMALSGSAGAEVQRPLATVVIGGLVTATLLTLLVLPILYTWVETIKVGKKKINGTLCILVFLMLLTPLGLSAQQTVSPTPFTLEEALNTALENNPSIGQGKYQIDMQKALKRTAIDIGKTEIMYQRGQYNSYIREDNSISIRQKIPFPTVFGNRSALGKSRVESSRQQLEITKNELIREVKYTWNQIAYLQAHQKVLARQDSLFENFLRAAEVRYRTGETRLLERTTAESQSINTKNLLEQSQGDIDIYLLRLKALMNVQETVTIDMKEFSKFPDSVSFDSAQIVANPHLRYWQQQVDVAEKQKAVEIGNLLPDLIFGYFNQTLIGSQNISGQEQFYGRSDRFTGFEAGIAIPLWFAPQKAKIKAAEMEKRATQKSLESFQLNLRTEYSAALKDYLKNSRSLNYYEETALPNAELMLTQSQTAFNAGEIGYVEYLQGVKNAISTQTNYLVILNQYNQSIINIEFILGNNLK